MIHIDQYLARLKMAQMRQAKTVTLPIAEANGLHNDLTMLLLQLREYQTAARPADTGTADLAGGEF